LPALAAACLPAAEQRRQQQLETSGIGNVIEGLDYQRPVHAGRTTNPKKRP